MILLLACSACEDNGTDVLEIEIPEGYALSAGTSTNFLNSSLAYELCRPVYTISEWYAEDIKPEEICEGQSQMSQGSMMGLSYDQLDISTKDMEDVDLYLQGRPFIRIRITCCMIWGLRSWVWD